VIQTINGVKVPASF